MGQGRGEGLEGGTKSRLSRHQKLALPLPPPFQGRALPWLSPGPSKTPLLPCPGQSLPSKDAHPVTAAPKRGHILSPSSLRLGVLLLSPSSATPSSPWHHALRYILHSLQTKKKKTEADLGALFSQCLIILYSPNPCWKAEEVQTTSNTGAVGDLLQSRSRTQTQSPEQNLEGESTGKG